VKFRTTDGRLIRLNQNHLKSVRMVVPGPGEDWRLSLQRRQDRETFVGEEARRLANIVLPLLNRRGGNRAAVADAVREIERSGGPEPFLLRLTEVATPRSGMLARPMTSREHPDTITNMVTPLAGLPVPIRLATEMVLHEEHERRALEGELAALEAAWRDAEEIAAIADNLLVPERTKSFLERQRQRDQLL